MLVVESSKVYHDLKKRFVLSRLLISEAKVVANIIKKGEKSTFK